MAMTKRELFQAFREVASMEFAEIPRDSSQIKFVFSKDFEDKMNALIKQKPAKNRKTICDLSEDEAY